MSFFHFYFTEKILSIDYTIRNQFPMKQTQSVTSDSEASFIPSPPMSSRGRQSRIGCLTVNISLALRYCFTKKKQESSVTDRLDCIQFMKVILWIIPFPYAVTL